MRKLDNIAFTEIQSIPQQIKDFLNGELFEFNEQTFSVENFEKIIQKKKENYFVNNRSVLADVLGRQMSEVELSALQQEHLSLISQTGTFTITTGHQLNLFTGPVFFIYKILQTIKTAAFLKQRFPENPFVPIFWMATEDHDFQEINHFKTENHLYQMTESEGGAVGRIKISDISFIADFEKEFQDFPFGNELILLLENAYQTGKTLSQATRDLVHTLFSEFGLLIIDGDDKQLKAIATDVFRDELLQKKLFTETQQQVENLKEKYGKVQVNPREINLFYLSDKRNRIEKNGSDYVIIDTDIIFSEEEIFRELQNFPEKFSPNALMRPVYQEVILPNIAYIGGNAEIMYWMELKDYFRKIDLTFPLLIPRNSMLFIKEKTVKKITGVGLAPEDFFSEFSTVVNSRLLENNTIHSLLKGQEDSLEKAFTRLSAAAEQTDITFGNLVNAEKTRQLKSFQRMEKRLLRAEKKKQHELLSRIEKLYQEIHPGGTWQERVLNFSVFYSLFGSDWLKTCLEEMRIQHSELTVMVI